jgi:uncharacterized membrane protein YoaK (UPF0700 family)
MDKQDLRDAWSAIWPFVPPAIGAYFGLKWSVQQSKRERITTWFCSAFLALFLGAAIGEHFQLGTKSTSGATIIVAMLLSDVMGAVIAVFRQWGTDPVGTFKRWRDAWLGRGGSQGGGT